MGQGARLGGESPLGLHPGGAQNRDERGPLSCAGYKEKGRSGSSPGEPTDRFQPVPDPSRAASAWPSLSSSLSLLSLSSLHCLRSSD